MTNAVAVQGESLPPILPISTLQFGWMVY